MRSLFLWALLFSPVAAVAEPERELREAVSAIARASYTWETTTRQRFKAESAAPRLETNAPVAVKGKTDGRGTVSVMHLAGREFPVPITAVFRDGDVVAHTPNGWLRRSELRQSPGGNREVAFEGKTLGLSRILGAALKATATRPLVEELFDAIAEVKAFRSENGLVLAELREQTIEQWWGDAQAKRAPEVHGTMIFKLSADGALEYHVVLGIGFPNSATKSIAWTLQQWSTRITDVGSTVVDVPAAALAALDR
jgi:hypothetical protein